MEAIKKFFSTLWDYWKTIGRFIGDIIGRVFLMLFYFTVALPFGIVTRLFNDPLDINDKAKPPIWRERTSPDATIEAGYGQM